MKNKNIHGILLLDKPTGISSNRILQKLKRIFFIKKAGYIGTLDPLATGILPICFGKCTKFSEYLSSTKKIYHVIAKLGQITSTYDSEGIILEKRKINFSQYQLYESLKKLTGKIFQTIPIYSAKKYKGLPLYQYARKNVFIPKIKKYIYIYEFNCIKYDNQFIEFKISCSQGTYIRTLIHDLGKLLQCGAHIISLRRIKFLSYNIAQTITFKQLYSLNLLYFKKNINNFFNQFLLSIKTFFFKLPEIYFSSYSQLFNLENIYYTHQYHNNIVRIIIQNHSNIFIIGKINHYGQLISYKILKI